MAFELRLDVQVDRDVRSNTVRYTLNARMDGLARTTQQERDAIHRGLAGHIRTIEVSYVFQEREVAAVTQENIERHLKHVLEQRLREELGVARLGDEDCRTYTLTRGYPPQSRAIGMGVESLQPVVEDASAPRSHWVLIDPAATLRFGTVGGEGTEPLPAPPPIGVREKPESKSGGVPPDLENDWVTYYTDADVVAVKRAAVPRRKRHAKIHQKKKKA